MKNSNKFQWGGVQLRVTNRLRTPVVVMVIAAMFLLSFFMGGFMTGNKGYAASGTLNSANGQWVGSAMDNGVETVVEYSGTYIVEVSGGGEAVNAVNAYGGRLQGSLELKKGDVLKAAILTGGAGGATRVYGGKGCEAVLLYLNGLPLIGAGGAGGSGVTYNRDTFVSSRGAGGSVKVIDNKSFSSGGGGGSYSVGQYGQDSTAGGAVGSTIAGSSGAAGGSPWAGGGAAGANYLADGKIDLVNQTNNSLDAGFKVFTKATTEADYPEIYKLMANNLGAIAEAIKASGGSGGGSTTMKQDIVTVIAAKSFDVYINGCDSTLGGTAQGVTIINNDTKDGYVQVVGKLDTVGNKEVVIAGIKYVFNVVEEPNSSNVDAVLN